MNGEHEQSKLIHIYTHAWGSYKVLYTTFSVSIYHAWGEMRNSYKIFGQKPEGKRPLGRRKSSWEDTRMGLKETVRRCGVDASGSG
jgi:hypothetical protein